MEALTCLLPKLAELLAGEYCLQTEVKGGIIFLQAELEHMKAALEKISKTPIDQLDKQDKIWARDVRDLSYEIEDKIDTFLVHCKGNKAPAQQHGLKKFIGRSLDLLLQPKIRRKIATDIRQIKNRVKEVSDRRGSYKTNNDIVKSVTPDPRLFTRYKKASELVGVDQERDEVIKILMQGNEVSKPQDKTVSIVGFGGLGKITLASMVFKKLRVQFDCSAFISVSQTPDMEKLFKDMFYELAKRSNESIDLIDELREFLHEKRYLIVVDDIWNISVWRTIKCALPDNNSGCKVITTTRIVSVGEQIGYAYKLKPLSLNNSRKLLYTRIFGDENSDNNEDLEKCPDEELAELSDRILQKCAGVPLAFITIACLLASKGRNKMEWYKVYNSIGNGLEDNLDAENMRKILSYSYYDLSSHLMTCLLYLSVFPEDFEIEKDRLIWLWIAEGFIQCEEQRMSLFELGESYFSELINRNMIQPVDKYDTGIIDYCRVHDMLLELIRYLSSQENFVTVVNDMDHTCASTTVRRLSLQNGMVHQAKTWESMKQVRSVVVFLSAIDDLMSKFERFKFLRVFDLHGCNLSHGYNLDCLGSLVHLRYLSLRGTYIGQLPEEVGNLKFLETLDARDTFLFSLPLTIVELKHLRCLHVHRWTKVPFWIGSLTSLEELSFLHIDEDSINTVEALYLLTELRVLDIGLSTVWNEKMVDCLRKLSKIQSLRIELVDQRNTGGLDVWVAPPHLRRLQARLCCWFSMLPAWMNPSHLSYLSILTIAVRGLQQKDLEILGTLPAVRCLDLEVDHEDLGIDQRLVVGPGYLPLLVRCGLWGFAVPAVFQHGAMPRLKAFEFEFSVREASEIECSRSGFYMGLGNLQSLKRVKAAWFLSGGTSEKQVAEAKAAVIHEVKIHPNRPSLRIR